MDDVEGFTEEEMATPDGLTNATNFVMLSHAEICERWREYFHGDTTFYK